MLKTIIPFSCVIPWAAALKALLLVLIIIVVIGLISWLVAELIWRKKDNQAGEESQENAEDTNAPAEEAEEITEQNEDQ